MTGYENTICHTGNDVNSFMRFLPGTLPKFSGYPGEKYERE